AARPARAPRPDADPPNPLKSLGLGDACTWTLMVSHGISWVSMGYGCKSLGILGLFLICSAMARQTVSARKVIKLREIPVHRYPAPSPDVTAASAGCFEFRVRKKRQMACKPGSVLAHTP